MTVPQKAIFSLLLSAFLVGSIAALAYIGIYDLVFSPAVKILMFVVFFFTVFLIVFFILSVKRNPQKIKAVKPSVPYSLGLASTTTSPCSSKKDPAAGMPPNGVVPKESAVKTSGFRLISVTENVRAAAELEEIPSKNGAAGSIVCQPFTVQPGDPHILPKAGSDVLGEVIVEQNGVHYINSDAISRDKNAEEKIDSDFVKLVKSVVGRA